MKDTKKTYRPKRLTFEATVEKKLRPYQKAGRDAALERFREHKFFLIADEMGLGKSIQALGVADKMRKKYNRICVVAPAGLVEKWKDEIKKHLQKNRTYSITIISYNEIIKPEKLHFYTQTEYDLLILDEAHYLKDFESLRTRAVLGAPGDRHKTLASVSRRVLGLSGTWPPNRVGEIYPLLFSCGHGITLGLTYEKFLYKYAEKTWETPYGTKHSGVKNEIVLRQLLSDTIIRRRLDDVEKDIPAGTVVNIPVECDLKTLQEEKELFIELLTEAGHTPNDFDLIFSTPDFLDNLLKQVPGFDRLSEFRKRQGLLKVKFISEYLVENVLPETEKFIVFCYHQAVAEKYFEILAKKTKNISIITGGNTSKETRFQIVKEADEKEKSIIVCTIDALREGFDMTGFQHSFYAESDWRVYAIEQTKGRTRRIGQTKPVVWTFFNFDKGVEALQAKRLLEKTNDVRKIYGE